MEHKLYGRSIILGKSDVLRFDLKELRETDDNRHSRETNALYWHSEPETT